MIEEKRVIKTAHNMILENRRTLTLSGVKDVGNFDERVINVITEMGELTIKGENLHINKLTLESGDLCVDGTIWQLSYSDTPQKSGGFFSRLFQ